MDLNFTSSYFGLVFNPVGYMAQRVPVEQASRDYAKKNPPSAGLLSGMDEVTFKEYRQSYIDQCAGKLKSDDVGKSLANASRNCAARFDESSQVRQLRADIQEQANNDRSFVLGQSLQNRNTLILLIAAFLIVGLLLYLFLS